MTKSSRNVLFFSLADLAQVINQGKRLLAAGAVVCALLAFSYCLLRPISFTAEGLFKGHTSPTNSRFVKAMEFLGMEDSYMSSDDPRSFLRSYPVLEQVVNSLHLQATITESGVGGRLHEVWNTLTTARAYRRLEKQKTPSLILGRDIYVPDRHIIADKSSAISCTALDFPSEISASLTVQFLDESAFHVKKKGLLLGYGKLDASFNWEGGSFTLSGQGTPGKTYGLHLIPLPQAVQSLQKSLVVTRDKENPSITLIRYTHRDRHLATRIVNETMEQFQVYLTVDGKKKITKQLTYLRERQEDAMLQLEVVLEKQKSYLETHLGMGVIPSLEKELEFMASTQAGKRHRLLEIQSEMQYLTADGTLFSELLEKYSDKIPTLASQALSVEAAHEMIRQHQQEIDALHMSKGRYDDCLDQLEGPDFDCSSLANILNDASLQGRFERMHTLHHRLIDATNWSSKEREQLKHELEIDKAFMKEHVRLLKEGADLHLQAIQKRVDVLHQDLLYLLADRYVQEKGALLTLSEQVKHFPEKWLNEQKITLNTKLYKEIMESITKMIEAKNIGYNLDYLLSQVLKPAVAPILPNHPRLLLGTLAGGAAGALCAFLGLCFLGIWRGPSASYSNLEQSGKHVIPLQDTIPLLGLALSGSVILLTSRHQPLFALSLIDWLKRKGEKVCVIDLTGTTTPKCLEGKDPQAALASSHFHNQLAAFRKEYDRVLIVSKGPIESFSTQALLACVDGVVYGISGEALENLDKLPEKTLFVLQQSAIETKIPLKAISPRLERLLLKMKSSSFSSAKRAWEGFFPSKRP